MIAFRRLLPWLVLSSLCLVAALLQWGRMEEFGTDSMRGLSDSYRVSTGQMPYRDFSWQYSPLWIFLSGGLFRVFGATFQTAQGTVDAVSLLLVFCLWRLARQLLAEPFATAITAAYLCTQSLNTSSALFTMDVSTPALHVGMAGTLLWLLGVVTAIREGEASRRSLVFVGVGSAVALLGKQEFAVAVIAGHLAWAVAERDRLRYHARLWVAAFAPSIVIYAALSTLTGRGPLIDGLTVYGISECCPWWPTGIGVTMAAQSLGLACFCTWAWMRVNRDSLAWEWPLPRWLRAMALAGLLAYLLPLPFRGAENQYRLHYQPFIQVYLFHPAVMLLLWSCIGLLACAAFVDSRTRTTRFSLTIVILCAGIAPSIRSFFNTTLGVLPSVAPGSYPFLFLAVLFLLLSPDAFYRRGHATSRAQALVLSAMLAGAALGLGNAAWKVAHIAYAPLQTRAGMIRVADPRGVAMYRTIERMTQPGDSIVEINGGGLSFAAHLRTPIFLTQYKILNPSQETWEADLDRMKRTPPGAIVIWSPPIRGGRTACSFPRLVWMPGQTSIVEGTKLTGWIASAYEPVLDAGGPVILAPAAPHHD